MITIDIPRNGSELPVNPEQRNSGFVGVRVTGSVQLYPSEEISTFQGVYLRFATEVMGDWRDLGQEIFTSFQGSIPGYDSRFSWEFYRQVPTEGRLRIEAVENFGENWGEEKGVPALCTVAFYTDTSVPQPPELPEPVRSMFTIQLQLVDHMTGEPFSGADVTNTPFKLWSRWQEIRVRESVMGTSYRPSGWEEAEPEVVTVTDELAEIASGRVTQLDVNTFAVSFDIGRHWQFFENAQEEWPELPASFNHALWDRVAGTLPSSLRQQPLRWRINPAGTVDFGIGVAGVNLPVRAGGILKGVDDSWVQPVSIDLANALVGHTTSDSVLLWFHWHHTERPKHACICEIDSVNSSTQPQTHVVDFEPPMHTAVVHASGLHPATKYRYELRLVARRDDLHEDLLKPGTGAVVRGRTLASGEFTTASTLSDSLSFVFASCHDPTMLGPRTADYRSLERWRELAGRRDYDLMLLIGDQIYGDHIGHPGYLGSTWEEMYRNHYREMWAFQPMREVLQRTPTYMIFDDHDVKDDWGSDPNFANEMEKKFPGRLSAALDAYRAFQHSHNPTGQDPPGPFYYGFRRGPAAFFVLDLRSKRNESTLHPILGDQQFNDFTNWMKTEAKEADVVFVVSTVPIAWLPVQQYKELMKKSVRIKGAFTGAEEGWEEGNKIVPVIGGFFGAAAGAVIGYVTAPGIFEDRWKEALTERDLFDQWTYKDNQIELAKVLELLFDLANDTIDGATGAHPRAVFILGGDVHIGGMHVIHSNMGRHNKRPYIYQLTSSPISNQPPPWRDVKEVSDKIDSQYILDDDTGRFSVSRWSISVGRNFGKVSFKRARKDRRVYQFSLAIEGASPRLAEELEVDLGAGALPTGPTAQGDGMQPGEVLNPGQSITSANGLYRFNYQDDGNLVLYDGGTPLWASGTNGRPTGICIMQDDGNLVIYAPGGQAIWSSDTWQYPDSRLVVQDDGDVVIYGPDGTPVWATNTWLPTQSTAQGDDMQPGEVLNPGQSITSANGRYRFIYQGDGNLVLYDGDTPLWASGTNGRPGGVSIMQSDGNLVIYAPGRQPIWSSDTWQCPNSRLIVQDDGNVVIYRPDCTPVWATNTGRG